MNASRRKYLTVWCYLINYILLAAAALMIVMVIIEGGAWRKLGIPVMLLSMGVGNLVRMRVMARRRAERIAAPNGGSATPLGDSGVTERPPSVS